MSFGTRLIAIRKEHKISQTDLAEKAGIHANVLGRYEREEATQVSLYDTVACSFVCTLLLTVLLALVVGRV